MPLRHRAAKSDPRFIHLWYLSVLVLILMNWVVKPRLRLRYEM
jgi:hypothetical protein